MFSNKNGYLELIRDLRNNRTFPDDIKRNGWFQNMFGSHNERKTKQLIDREDKDIIRRMVNKIPTDRPNIAEVEEYVEGKLFEKHYI